MASAVGGFPSIEYESDGFPVGGPANGTAELVVSWSEIVWAALTIGRPPLHRWLKHGQASLYEAMMRFALIRMALEERSTGPVRLHRSGAFADMDPTEKGAVSYFLGMTICKVFSSRLLATPWLLHLDVFGPAYGTRTLGRSRPDLFGESHATGDWLAFETKGRASKPNATDLAKAKAQASRLASVGAAPCAMHVASFAYFAGDVLRFRWVDPMEDDRQAFGLPVPGEEWRHYYEPARALFEGRPTPAGDGLSVSVPEADLEILVHPAIAAAFLLRAWEAARNMAVNAKDQLRADGFQADGLRVKCGPSWSERSGD